MTWGEGPPLVSIPPTAQNIEMAWEWPPLRAMFERFGSFSTILAFDKRGTGVSDRRSHMPGLDERVDDLRAVMDDAGLDRAHLFGASEGGPTTLMFAATYPERVLSVIVNGAGARTIPDMTPEEAITLKEQIGAACTNFGTPASPFVDFFAPSAAGDQTYRNWHQRYERNSADSASLHELMVMNFDVDVREILPQVQVPALILHRAGDLVVPVELAEELAGLLPNARLVVQDGVDHFNYVGETDAWLDEIERFVAGEVTSTPIAVRRGRPTIVTLGRFAVEVDGDEVPIAAWGSRMSRQLCKRLVAARGRPVTRDELIDLLWPDETDRGKAGARLSVQLSAVRRVLGGGVTASRDSVGLDIDEVETDLDRFFAASDDAEIVERYGGTFLPDDAYADWSGPTRDEVRFRFVAAARREAQRLAGADEREAAMALARRLIETDRYDEEAHRSLVRWLAAAGERGESRKAHQDWVDALGELDVEVPPFDSCI